MSYVSGFMLGASIGKAVHSFLHGSPQSTVTPGRGFVTAPQNVRTAPPTNCVTPAFACVSSLPRRFGKSEGHYVCTGKCHNGRYSYLC